MQNRFSQQIVEKFHRNEEIVAVRDIATREFKMNDNKIFLLFHYADGNTFLKNNF